MENPNWILHTDGDIEKRIQDFLAGIWKIARLAGMIVPVYGDETNAAGPNILDSINDLENANPFIPLMPLNTSRLVENLARDYPSTSFAAVLRPCETRAVEVRMQQNNLNLSKWIVIGVDCLANFSKEDFSWRAERAGSPRELTRQVLRNARQGGISIDRFRTSCQICAQPSPKIADICISVAGLPIRQFALVTLHNPRITEQFDVQNLTDGTAPSWIIEQHEHVVRFIVERNKQIKQRLLSGLQSGFPQDVEAWIRHLKHCSGCEACLDACPLYNNQLEINTEAVAEWLANCVSCGMCEQACPKQLPLTMIIHRIVDNIYKEYLPV